MSDGSLFDLFIQGASNGGTLTEANKWWPYLFPAAEWFRETVRFYILLASALLCSTLGMKITSVRLVLFVQALFVFFVCSIK